MAANNFNSYSLNDAELGESMSSLNGMFPNISPLNNRLIPTENSTENSSHPLSLTHRKTGILRSSSQRTQPAKVLRFSDSEPSVYPAVSDYDRANPLSDVSVYRRTPRARREYLKQLNYYKMYEMTVHPESAANTRIDIPPEPLPPLSLTSIITLHAFLATFSLSIALAPPMILSMESKIHIILFSILIYAFYFKWRSDQ